MTRLVDYGPIVKTESAWGHSLAFVIVIPFTGGRRSLQLMLVTIDDDTKVPT